MQDFSDNPPIAILPLGAHEQHGPHLPFDTDTIIAQGFLQHVQKLLPQNLYTVVLPVETVGYSPEHLWCKGTKSLSYSEAIERWIKIGHMCHQQGKNKLVLFNAHGGNSPLLTIVATELRLRYSMLCVVTSWTRFGLPRGIVSKEERALDIHGGLLETSLMLALAPEKVRLDFCKNFSNAQKVMCKDFRYLRAYGPHAFGWLMCDLNREGAAGNAQKATAQLGKKILNHTAKRFIKLLYDVDRFELSAFKNDDRIEAHKVTLD